VRLTYLYRHVPSVPSDIHLTTGVSPWQFKDFDDDASNSWVEYSDVLFPNRRDQAISTVKPDIVEFITWNDFPESHYIRDLPPTSGSGLIQLGVASNYVHGQTHASMAGHGSVLCQLVQERLFTSRKFALITWHFT